MIGMHAFGEQELQPAHHVGRRLVLVQVQAVFRHGAKTSQWVMADEERHNWPASAAEPGFSLVPTRPIKPDGSLQDRQEALSGNAVLPGSFGGVHSGVLSTEGWQMMRALGKSMRQFYAQLLPNTLDGLQDGQLECHCTAVTRVVDSVTALLTGLFPADANANQTPVVLSLDGLDGLDPWHCTLSGGSMPLACAMASQLEAHPLTRPPYAKEIRRQLEDALDLQLPNIEDVRHRFFVWSDVLACRASAGSGPVPPDVPLEEWRPRKEDGRGGIDYKRLSELAAWEMSAGWYTRGDGAQNKPSFLGEKTAPLLNRICDRLAMMAEQHSSGGTTNSNCGNSAALAPLLSLWGGHDTTIAPLREALGIKPNSPWPKFGSSIIFELYMEDANAALGPLDQTQAAGPEWQFFVRVLSEGQEQLLWGGVAGAMCPLEYFIAHLQCLQCLTGLAGLAHARDATRDTQSRL
jgi:hypothetical protein